MNKSQIRIKEEHDTAKTLTFEEILIKLGKIKMECEKIEKIWGEEYQKFKALRQTKSKEAAKWNRYLRYKKEQMAIGKS